MATQPPRDNGYETQKLREEIKHLHTRQTITWVSFFKKIFWWTLTLTIMTLITMFFWDPVARFAYKREAVRVVRYMVKHDKDSLAEPLLNCGIFTAGEIDYLRTTTKPKADALFRSTDHALAQGDWVIRYMRDVEAIAHGTEPENEWMKWRFFIFTKTLGIPLPQRWHWIEPKASMDL